jgi:hypothetical protein
MREGSTRGIITSLVLCGLAAGCAAQTGSSRSSVAPPTSDEMLSLSIMHGLTVSTSYGADSSDPASRPTCIGSGADKAHAVQMRSTRGQGEVKDAMACALQLYPGAQIGPVAFAPDGARYYTIVELTDSSGQEREVYTDTTPWAEDFLTQMRQKQSQS